MKQNKYFFKGMDVYYYIEGDPSNEPLVLLHPAFGDHNIFNMQIDYFKEKYYIIAFDMISHGLSQIGSSQANMGDMPEVVKNVLELLKIEKAHLIGVSMGSLVAQGVAHFYPELIKSVTIVGGYSIHKDNKGIMKEQRKEMFKWVFYILFSMKKFRKYLLDMSIYTKEGKTLFLKGINQFTRKSFKGMQGIDKFMVQKNEPMEYPLLILSGTYDSELVKKESKRIESLEPKGIYIEIPNAGHCANADNSQFFNQAVEDFLKAIS